MSLQIENADVSLLQVKDLSVRLRGETGTVHAVSDVSFSLQRGQTLGVVGESGSGKSVMARALMGLLPRRATREKNGQILLATDAGNTDILTLSERTLREMRGRDMAMVFQDPMTALNPVLTLGVQITEPLRQHLRMNRAKATERAVELLSLVGLPDPTSRINQYPHQLSGGMRQRVVIAIALACNPRLLIADEPTTALDVTVQRQILDLLTGLQQQRQMGMILISHDLGVVANRADNIAVMYAGRIVEYAPVQTLFSAMQHPYTQALLKSVPRLSDPPHTRLQAISGRPPQLINPSPGCAFAPRCPYARQRCHRETPPVTSAADNHRFACFYPVSEQTGMQSNEVWV
ncbi:ABC transporter ATP-binding protein [Pseudohongiella spirulinae]|uniref:ABC-type dipeptide transporter n=1 Tax=Pseudohongiella spirulinae TaxID=1249552 RepID=A0A0S2KBG5_9GAMM|nr:ABC transporter ATP-binding protein [Pseudohongiella spirulinae]ALO45675.1 Peptide ABC transporter ATP-binding protein [Pseudohongiella spirulinae]